MVVKNISKIGTRGTIFTFEDDITVYLIQGTTKWFLCDTHLGPQSMVCIKEYMTDHAKGNDVIVFNSHSDWDHIWGNCAFPEAMIIGHETCKKRMAEQGQFDLVRLPEYHCGKIKIILPNVTFSERITFAEEQLEFSHGPGHTIDSSLCFDRKDAVLFVGDLVEDPIPYLDFYDLEVYYKTLSVIKEFPAKIKISAHSGIIDNALIERNMQYIQDILHNNLIHPMVYEGSSSVHNFNLNNRLFLQYENIVREKLKENFNYAVFKSNFSDLETVNYVELQAALEVYLLNLQGR